MKIQHPLGIRFVELPEHTKTPEHTNNQWESQEHTMDIGHGHRHMEIHVQCKTLTLNWPAI